MERHGHRLIQFGMALFLAALLIGLAVPAFRLPRLALSAHLLLITQGLFLMILGLIWPRLRLSSGMARATFILAIYACIAASMANLVGASIGAGDSIVPMAAGGHRGSANQELLVVVLLRSGGAAFIAASVLVLWGLRLPATTSSRASLS